jgi:hypothetical protein
MFTKERKTMQFNFLLLLSALTSALPAVPFNEEVLKYLGKTKTTQTIREALRNARIKVPVKPRELEKVTISPIQKLRAGLSRLGNRVRGKMGGAVNPW